MKKFDFSALFIGIICVLLTAAIGLFGWIGEGIWNELRSTHDAVLAMSIVQTNMQSSIVSVEHKCDVQHRECMAEISRIRRSPMTSGAEVLMNHSN